MKRFEGINPCVNCAEKSCGLVDGQECPPCNDFLSQKSEFKSLKSELELVRQYIHDNGLEWDLLSAYKTKEKYKYTTIYYAHSIFKYNTPVEEYELSLIPGHIINPNGAVDQTKTEKEIMQHCFSLIEKCDGLAFSSLEGVIGKGVADEILYAFAKNKAVYYIHNNKLNRIKEITIKPIVGSKTRRIYATFDYTEVV